MRAASWASEERWAWAGKPLPGAAGGRDEGGSHFVGTATVLRAATAPDDKLLGFFHLSDMRCYFDREYFQNEAMLGGFNDQPLLWDMGMKAIEVLSRNEEGFLLIVESGMNDKFLHPLDWHRATWDVLEMDRAIEVAQAWAATNGNETLILTTADHGHGFSTHGTYGTYDATQGVGMRDAVGVYQLAGFPTYGDRLDRNGLPVPDTDRILAVGNNNHPDYCELFMAPAVRQEDGNHVPNPVRCEMGGTLMQGNLPLAASWTTPTCSSAWPARCSSIRRGPAETTPPPPAVDARDGRQAPWRPPVRRAELNGGFMHYPFRLGPRVVLPASNITARGKRLLATAFLIAGAVLALSSPAWSGLSSPCSQWALRGYGS